MSVSADRYVHDLILNLFGRIKVMEITAGSIMFIAGAAGAAVCLIAFLVTAPLFIRQKRKLLERLQEM